jgi:hypothetical protein
MPAGAEKKRSRFLIRYVEIGRQCLCGKAEDKTYCREGGLHN